MRKYIYGFLIGMLSEYLIKVKFDQYALFILILLIIGVIILELNEKTTIFTDKD